MVDDTVKKFQIIGEVKKPLTKIPFSKTISALKLSDAIEKVMSDMGSRHKAKRFEIKIMRTEQLKE
jgi:ribosomal protein L20A (L18A)